VTEAAVAELIGHILAVFGLVVLLRALPWSAELARRKPISCHVCMSFWVSAALLLSVSVQAGPGAPSRHIAALGWAGGAVALLYLLDLVKVLVDVRSLQAKPFEAGDLIEPPNQ
jgi:hypothetical protein